MSITDIKCGKPRKLLSTPGFMSTRHGVSSPWEVLDQFCFFLANIGQVSRAASQVVSLLFLPLLKMLAATCLGLVTCCLPRLRRRNHRAAGAGVIHHARIPPRSHSQDRLSMSPLPNPKGSCQARYHDLRLLQNTAGLCLLCRASASCWWGPSCLMSGPPNAQMPGLCSECPSVEPCPPSRKISLSSRRSPARHSLLAVGHCPDSSAWPSVSHLCAPSELLTLLPTPWQESTGSLLTILGLLSLLWPIRDHSGQPFK